MRHLYDYNSPVNEKYGMAIMEHVKYKFVSEESIDFHVPLILKTIKFCHLRRLSCDDLITFITKNMHRFKKIFEEKGISKGLFFSLIFEKNHSKDLSPEILLYLQKYFIETVEKCSNAVEVDEG